MESTDSNLFHFYARRYENDRLTVSHDIANKRAWAPCVSIGLPPDHYRDHYLCFPRWSEAAHRLLLRHVRHHGRPERQPRPRVHQDLRARHAGKCVEGRKSWYHARGNKDFQPMLCKKVLHSMYSANFLGLLMHQAHFWFMLFLRMSLKLTLPNLSGGPCGSPKRTPRRPRACRHVRHQEVLHWSAGKLT